jgi:hypothetical protein
MLHNRTAASNDRQLPRLLGLALILLTASGAVSPVFAQCRYRPASSWLPAGLKLTIRAEKPVAETSRPTVIHIELSNESNMTIRMRDNWFADRDYELYVRDANGREAPLTKWGNDLRTGPVHGSGNDLTLAPGEKHTAKEDLSSVYEISMPGTYTVQACREVYGWGNIYSARITIPFVLPAVGAK